MQQIDFAKMGARIAERRKALGWGQRELFLAVRGPREKVRVATISEWERGVQHDIYIGDTIRLAQALRCDIDWLLFGDQQARLPGFGELTPQEIETAAGAIRLRRAVEEKYGTP